MSSIQRENRKNSKKRKIVQKSSDLVGNKNLHKRNSVQQAKEIAKKSLNSNHCCESTEEFTQSSARDINYRAVTDQLQEKILGSLNLFKEASSEYMKNSEYLSDKFINFGYDLDMIQGELSKIANEKEKTLDELGKLKKMLENPKKFIRTQELMDENDLDAFLLEKLNGLKTQVRSLKNRVDKSEQLIGSTPRKSHSKSQCFSGINETILDSSISHTNCNNCIIT